MIEDGRIDGRLHAPLRPDLPVLQPGKSYLVDVVVRTTGLGHQLTQGTVDSNELWLDVSATTDGRVIGRSGAMDATGGVDPWAYFVNAYVLDRDGNRIDRRNGQDIFTPLYNHQIPPGAADVVHYRLRLPADARGPLRLRVRVLYRKFDTRYLRYIQGEAFAGNDLPVSVLAEDELVLPVGAADPAAARTWPPRRSSVSTSVERLPPSNRFQTGFLASGIWSLLPDAASTMPPRRNARDGDWNWAMRRLIKSARKSIGPLRMFGGRTCCGQFFLS